MAEARSQQAASLTEFHWLGHRFPISNAKIRVAILKGTCHYICILSIVAQGALECGFPFQVHTLTWLGFVHEYIS